MYQILSAFSRNQLYIMNYVPFISRSFFSINLWLAKINRVDKGIAKSFVIAIFRTISQYKRQTSKSLQSQGSFLYKCTNPGHCWPHKSKRNIKLGFFINAKSLYLYLCHFSQFLISKTSKSLHKVGSFLYKCTNHVHCWPQKSNCYQIITALLPLGWYS